MANDRWASKLSNRGKQSNLYSVLIIAFLCAASYLFGIWHHSGRGITRSASLSNQLELIASVPCKFPLQPSPPPPPPVLTFASRHTSPDPSPPPPAEIPSCGVEFSEYTPCEFVNRSLSFPRKRLIYRERHCPRKEEMLRCRIPAPYGYTVPFRWPESRDVAWFANVPHTELTVEKKNQNWVRYEKDRFLFPGGGTMFPRGADSYIDDIGRFINLKDGSIRTAIDTGCGVASFGAYLMSRNIVTMSFAPRDTHEAQVQFALERGVPAIIGVLASIRLPFPARAFDMAHCSRCLIPWGHYNGTYLIEVDRVLRPGGYWVLSGPPINWQKHWKGWERSRDDLKSEQAEIESVARSLCWKKLVQRDDLAIWQKPTNHIHCKRNRIALRRPPFCHHTQPDQAWYAKLEECLTPLPEVTIRGSEIKEVAGGKLARWPERLNAVPPRIRSESLKGVSVDEFVRNTETWQRRVSYYKSIDKQLTETGRYRNLLDMNAYIGGFASALVDDPVWVMNVVPVEPSSVNTLGVIYERGLIGTYQNWCEAMSSYPRTYDLVHADTVFSMYKGRCEMEDILIEMDRIVRPKGSVIIRDDIDVINKVKKITDGMQWDGIIRDNENGPFDTEKILFIVKEYWTAPAPHY
ncbi:unnamed protein product [Cochlearia groenlandica]